MASNRWAQRRKRRIIEEMISHDEGQTSTAISDECKLMICVCLNMPILMNTVLSSHTIGHGKEQF